MSDDDSESLADPTPAPWPLLVFVPIVVGAVTGVLVGFFVYLVETLLLGEGVLGLPGLWFAIPAVLVFVLTRLAMQRVAGTLHPGTAELYPLYYHHSELKYPLHQTPGRLLSGVTTVGFGGSQGLESQSALIGDSVGILLRRIFGGRLAYLATPAGRNLLLVSGAAAGIATVFSSPILGAAYGIEMPFRNRIDGRRLVPSLLAATSSFLAAQMVHKSRSLMEYVPHEISVKEGIGVVVVGILCGCGARLFAWLRNRVRGYQDGSHPWARAWLAGIVLSALAMTAWLVTGAAITAGPGYIASAWALPTNGGPSPVFWVVLVALIVRATSVMLCVAAGGGGGVFTSLATNGLLVGVLIADLLDVSNPTLLALAGVCAFLGAGYRLPLATAGLAAQTAGAAVPTALCVGAIALAMLLMSNHTAASTQSDATAK